MALLDDGYEFVFDGNGFWERQLRTMNFSAGTASRLQEANITSLDQLCQMSKEDLTQLPGFERTFLREVQERLRDQGLWFEMTSFELEAVERVIALRDGEQNWDEACLDLQHLEVGEALLQWVQARSGGSSLRDLLKLVGDEVPGVLRPSVEAALDIELTSAGGADSFDNSIARMLGTLGDREAAVISTRFGLNDGRTRTLEEIGTLLGVSRERVRQIQVKAMSSLRHPSRSGIFTGFVALLSEHLGGGLPREVFASEFPGVSNEGLQLINTIFGECFRLDAEFVCMTNVSVPAATELPRMRGCDYLVDELAALEQLGQSGFSERSAELVLEAMPGLFEYEGRWLLEGSSIVDRGIAVLEVEDEPLEVRDVFLAVGADSERSFRQRMFEDPRISRVTKSRIGLTNWGGVVYSGIVDAMVQRLASGPMDIDDLAIELASQYEVSTTSVYMFSAAPVFKAKGGVIALRAAGDPYVPRHELENVPELRITGPNSFELDLVVDADMLRGSGRRVPHEVANLLNISPGDDRLFMATDQHPAVPIVWPITSHVGPQLGSIKTLLGNSDAAAGDEVILRFGAAPPSLEIVVKRRRHSMSTYGAGRR